MVIERERERDNSVFNKIINTIKGLVFHDKDF